MVGREGGLTKFADFGHQIRRFWSPISAKLVRKGSWSQKDSIGRGKGVVGVGEEINEYFYF